MNRGISKDSRPPSLGDLLMKYNAELFQNLVKIAEKPDSAFVIKNNTAYIDKPLSEPQCASVILDLIEKSGRLSMVYVDAGRIGAVGALTTATTMLRLLRAHSAIYEPVMIGPAVGDNRAIGYEACRAGLRTLLQTFEERVSNGKTSEENVET